MTDKRKKYLQEYRKRPDVKTKSNIRTKLWRQRNIEHITSYSKNYRKKHKEKYALYAQSYGKKYYQKHKEKWQIIGKLRRINKKEQISLCQKKYYKKHKTTLIANNTNGGMKTTLKVPN